jgi:phospholipid transport system substrate-binding protein
MRALFQALSVRHFLLPALALFLPLVALSPVKAATPAEAFVSENIQKGLVILNNTSWSKEERRQQFQNFLLNMTDMKRISETALGAARRTAAPADLAAYNAAFKDYAIAVYHSYMACYAGQTLKVLGSTDRSANGRSLWEVSTQLIYPGNSKPPLQVQFRLVQDGGRFLVVDFSAEGVWVNILQRDQFKAFLDQNNGNLAALTSDLKTKTANLRDVPPNCH